MSDTLRDPLRQSLVNQFVYFAMNAFVDSLPSETSRARHDKLEEALNKSGPGFVPQSGYVI
jgi:hypothetical protein